MEDRLLKLLDTEQLSSSKFADVIGVQRSSVSHILTGRNKPSFDFLQKTLKAFPMLNADWLILGEGEMYEGGLGPGGGSLFDQPAVRTGGAAPGQADQSGDHPSHSGSSSVADDDISGVSGGTTGKQSAGEVHQQVLQQDQSAEQPYGSRPGGQQEQSADQQHGSQGAQHEQSGSRGDQEAPQRGQHQDRQQIAVHATDYRGIQNQRPSTGTQGDTLAGPPAGTRRVSKVILFYTDNSFDAFEPA
jgi:transcriptional regulator with XRE-family HTH domain